nr:homolog of Synechocystis YCF37 [Tanacetum cinerariifolium]
MAPKSIEAICHAEREELRKKGIKSPSKLFSLKYLSSASIKKLNKNSSAPKHVHFVNSFVILSKDSDIEDEDVSSNNTHEHCLGSMMRNKEEVNLQGKEEDEIETDEEVDEVFEDKESEIKTKEEVKEVFDDETEKEEDDDTNTATLLLDASWGLCKCGNDEWRSFLNGTWSSVMSPYEQRFVDVKYTSAVYGFVIVTLLETLGFVNFKLYESINLKYPPILDPRLKALAAADIGLFGLRKKIEKVEEEAVEVVKKGLESSENGVEAIERGEKEIQSEVSFELGSGGGLMQAGVVAGAEVVGGLIATSVVNGILGPGSTWLLKMFLFMSAPKLNTIIVVIGNLELVGQNLKN